MRTIAVLPIKSFGAAKQRLSGGLPTGSRHLLAQAMFFDVLSSLRRARRLETVAVVTDDHEIEATLRGDPIIVLRDHARAGQSAATRIGIDHALAEGFDRVLLVPGDTPLVDAAAIDGLLEASRAERLGAAIVPDRHRAGTNALLIAPPDALAPSFGPGSLERHVEAARAGGLEHRVEEVGSLMHDVDTLEDLAALAEVLDQHRGTAPRTRGALRQFDRLRLADEPDARERRRAAADLNPLEKRAPEPAQEAPDGAWRPTREGTPSDQRAAWA
ncbi:MAG: 2-phospho-L-lactate guanylyltransferase [Thermoleophilaceae bacterium]|jgi:2-phospho-L-lactate guanylyltransferase